MAHHRQLIITNQLIHAIKSLGVPWHQQQARFRHLSQNSLECIEHLLVFAFMGTGGNQNTNIAAHPGLPALAQRLASRNDR